jgi:hypothetical protein
LEVAYVEQPGSPFTSFCLFEQGSKCLDDFAQQQPNYYKLVSAGCSNCSSMLWHLCASVMICSRPQ